MPDHIEENYGETESGFPRLYNQQQDRLHTSKLTHVRMVLVGVVWIIQYPCYIAKVCCWAYRNHQLMPTCLYGRGLQVSQRQPGQLYPRVYTAGA